MGTYATSTDLIPRIGNRPLTATSTPSTTHVDTWIAEAEAMITAAILSGGGSMPTAVSDGGKIMTSWALDYAEGHFRQSNAAAAGDHTNEDGKDLLAAFDERLEAMIDQPARYDAILNAGAAADATRRVRGHVLDNKENKSVSAGDYDPAFTRNDPETQV